jgi:ribonucleoside-diphosphate reductase alpha chain
MSIFELAKTEARLFKYGSGTGTNFSKIRGKQEKLSGGGYSSGLMSFLSVLDKGAGATKSGGTTRRAAKMVCLDADHPEIVDFIEWKAKEEKKAKILIEAGYSSDFNDEAYATVSGQNSNNSVRLNDSFMNSALNDEKWETHMITTGVVADTYNAGELLEKISTSAWSCADPGIQFDDTINKWNTCKNSGKINASNPCSEYMFLDDTACNLASINLSKYSEKPGEFDVEAYKHTIRIMILAQEILVDFGSYPTEKIAKNSHDFRPLGLGYANLGALLMKWAIRYDSEKGRNICSAITSLLTGEANYTSSQIAKYKAPFVYFEKNKEPFLDVLQMHRSSSHDLKNDGVPPDLFREAKVCWDRAINEIKLYGCRNAQTTVLAPTGTIGLLMDCDTTGIEPDYSIVKWKKLAGGGFLKIINSSVQSALDALGYNQNEIDDITEYILGTGKPEGVPLFSYSELSRLGFSIETIEEAYDSIRSRKSFDSQTIHINPKSLLKRGLHYDDIQKIEKKINGAQTIEGAPHLKEEHLPIFDCANTSGDGKRFLSPMSHLNMMAAAQPFLSGAISKTINLPNATSADEIKELFLRGWELGLKAVTLYRDGSKNSQPLNTKLSTDDDFIEQVYANPETVIPRGVKRTLPKRRGGFTTEANVAGQKIYLRTGEYEDGRLGEIFIDVHKEGASFRSILNCFAMAVSNGLQYGIPVEKFVDAFTFTRFEPQGVTDHPNIRTCTSVIDFIFRVIGMEYLGRTDFLHVLPTKRQLEEMDRRLKQNQMIPNIITAEYSSNPPVDIQKYIIQPELPGIDIGSNLKKDGRTRSYMDLMGDAPPCDNCGHITIRNGSCYRCTNCGSSMGCS